ncbi:MAG: hypothetical protein KME30_31130 [Iphinoe sp. HA4291-MV1]|nr:hypothetical protein [Iphinoe sp. HA4291-MV1]
MPFVYLLYIARRNDFTLQLSVINGQWAMGNGQWAMLDNCSLFPVTCYLFTDLSAI